LGFVLYIIINKYIAEASVHNATPHLAQLANLVVFNHVDGPTSALLLNAHQLLLAVFRCNGIRQGWARELRGAVGGVQAEWCGSNRALWGSKPHILVYPQKTAGARIEDAAEFPRSWARSWFRSALRRWVFFCQLCGAHYTRAHGLQGRQGRQVAGVGRDGAVVGVEQENVAVAALVTLTACNSGLVAHRQRACQVRGCG